MKHIWTKEFCIKVITDVKERGFDEVSKEMGYNTSNILRCSLRSNSRKFGLLDEYNKNQPTYRRITGLVVRKNPFIRNTTKKIRRQDVLIDEPLE